MWLAYFDENKFDLSTGRDSFWIGGIYVSEEALPELEKRLRQIQTDIFGSSVLSAKTELHGKELFHGKGNLRRHSLPERLKVFNAVADALVELALPLQLIRIDVAKHRKRYTTPEPEYRLGLMLILERYSEFLEQQEARGLVFCDYEADEITQAVMDFSAYKQAGSTKYWFGRSLEPIHDTIYFTYSHHSRFLQAADLMVYLAARFDHQDMPPAKWHEAQAWAIWQKIKASVRIQHWP
ncbi:DUF3800 domain-containing protein [Allofranklinella schreckenbergeri]|uniref:DUF3800 domain-containing protein n=2 Tax=Comamonadaceae TaxID=80864 RepID=A0A3M6QW94_9BURK|nr:MULTISPECIES: DUF3800 domain-containing protein [Comamonadaceae]PAT36569.1 hypothetical protein CK625_10830 [Vandammella animalimorsus]RMX00995.1 DUF3800 domain-containing protein [Allofranklinella schreckenbergeri]RMX07288.1 DUF3800 domain-containing protein [Allofranklinella schreckenbergeri]